MRRLVIRPGGIGDCILSLAAIERLRADYTEVWVAPQNVPLVRGFDAVRSIPSTGLDRLGLPEVAVPPALVERLSAFDSIVSWYGTNRAEFRDAVARWPFTFFDALPPEGGRIHATDFFLEQAHTISPGGGLGREAAGLETGLRAWRPAPRCGGGTAIHPFSGSARKNWPLENFRRLAEVLEGPVHWCAGPEEELAGAVRFDNLWDLACWLATARLYIGNDSGITHLAAAVGVPVIALFGPTDPAVWAPRGDRVRVVRIPEDYFRKPMPLKITPSTRWSPGGAKVLSTVRAALAEG